MSTGNNHVFNVLDKNSKALTEDQRLVRLIAKGANKSPNLAQSLCVSIPQVTSEQVVEYIDALLPYVVGMVADVQDKMIREYRINTGASSVNEDVFSIPAAIQWLAANATGERLTGAMIKEWFTSDYKEACIQWLSSKPALSKLNTNQLEPKFNAICGLMEQFANPHVKLGIKQLGVILDFANNVEHDGRMAGIVAKTMELKKKLEEESAALEDIFG